MAYLIHLLNAALRPYVNWESSNYCDFHDDGVNIHCDKLTSNDNVTESNIHYDG